jgi:hypothetical protein
MKLRPSNGRRRWHALTLGIPGISPGADASRLRAARRVQEEYLDFRDALYTRSFGPVDPDPGPPFCLPRLIRAKGNIQRVLDGPDFAGQVLEHMGRGPREEARSDEDGDRWVSVHPTIYDYRAAAREAARIRAELEIRGLIPRRTPGQAVIFGFTPADPQYPTPTSRPGRRAPVLTSRTSSAGATTGLTGKPRNPLAPLWNPQIDR